MAWEEDSTDWTSSVLCEAKSCERWLEGLRLKKSPEEVEKLAVAHGAVAPHKGNAQFKSFAVLLRMLSVYLHSNLSLKSTAAFGAAKGWVDVSGVGLRGAFIRSVPALHALLNELFRDRYSSIAAEIPTGLGRQLLAIDATSFVVKRLKSEVSGLKQSIHLVLNLVTLELEQLYFPIDRCAGETFINVKPVAEAIYLGDRVYCTTRGLHHLRAHNAHAIVRYNRSCTLKRTVDGKKLNLKKYLKSIQPGAVGRMTLWATTTKCSATKPVRVRLIFAHQSPQAKARELASRRVSKQKVNKTVRFWAGYIVLLTTLDAEEVSPEDVLKLYRARWEIELEFKRMKSICKLSRRPVKTDDMGWATTLGALVTYFATTQPLKNHRIGEHHATWQLTQLAQAAFLSHTLGLRWADLDSLAKRFVAHLKRRASRRKRKTQWQRTKKLFASLLQSPDSRDAAPVG